MFLIEQVETLLKTQDPVVTTTEIPNTTYTSGPGNSNGIAIQNIPVTEFGLQNPSIGIVEGVNAERWRYNGDSPQASLDNMGFSNDLNMGMGLDDSTFTWEMIGLGLEEPLPPQDTIDELYVPLVRYLGIQAYFEHRHQIYFEKIHPSVPMMHKYRYLAAMNL